MTQSTISSGTVHTVPVYIEKAITARRAVQATWEDITPLARNEWLCWVESAKKSETRARRLKILQENLGSGKRRPCCWAGCPHRS